MSKRMAAGFGLRAGLVGLVFVAAACSAGGDTERASSVQDALTLAVPYRVRAFDFTAFNDSDTEGHPLSLQSRVPLIQDRGQTRQRELKLDAAM